MRPATAIALVVSMAAAACAAAPPAEGPADQPAPRTDANSQLAHAQLVEKARRGGIDVYFEGDSITRRWGTSDAQYADLLVNWTRNFYGWNAADFGWGADKIQNILWRLEHDELDGVNPKVIVVQAGANNLHMPADDPTIAEIARGFRAIVDDCHRKAPAAIIVLTAMFPRSDDLALMPTIGKVNARLAAMADGRRVRYLNVNDRLADREGRVLDGMMNADGVHPTERAYQVWADGLKPILTDLLGPPAATDHAPPPTGDPSANGKQG